MHLYPLINHTIWLIQNSSSIAIWLRWTRADVYELGWCYTAEAARSPIKTLREQSNHPCIWACLRQCAFLVTHGETCEHLASKLFGRASCEQTLIMVFVLYSNRTFLFEIMNIPYLIRFAPYVALVINIKTCLFTASTFYDPNFEQKYQSNYGWAYLYIYIYRIFLGNGFLRYMDTFPMTFPQGDWNIFFVSIVFLSLKNAIRTIKSLFCRLFTFVILI